MDDPCRYIAKRGWWNGKISAILYFFSYLSNARACYVFPAPSITTQAALLNHCGKIWPQLSLALLSTEIQQKCPFFCMPDVKSRSEDHRQGAIKPCLQHYVYIRTVLPLPVSTVCNVVRSRSQHANPSSRLPSYVTSSRLVLSSQPASCEVGRSGRRSQVWWRL